MKCPHCCQEHPDEFEICPTTGKNLKIACNNEDCSYYGEILFPWFMRQCPCCGQPLLHYHALYKSCKHENYSIKGINIRFIKIQGGKFKMGGTPEQGESASKAERLSEPYVDDFMISEFPVTQQLWSAVMDDNPSKFKGENRPVTNVTLYDCLEFIERLNRLTGETFRLPEEEEWEYAARGGNMNSNFTKYAGSDAIDDVAWYYSNGGHVTHDVGLKLSNELGLFDMSGNVWEWCNTEEYDRYGQYHECYINRGGCATSQENGCRTSRRYFSKPYHKSCYLGFRLAKW